LTQLQISDWHSKPYISFVPEVILDRCYQLAKNSPCVKAKFGAVILREHEIVGEGWNHSPNPAFQDCEHQCAGGIRLGIASGTRVELCHAGHAEGWAIAAAGREAQGGLIYVAGTDKDGNKLLKDPSLPLGNPRRGFYCTLCIRHIWMAGLRGIWVNSVNGPLFQTLDEAWETSYSVAVAGVGK
jgi:dCMP deaminase